MFPSSSRFIPREPLSMATSRAGETVAQWRKSADTCLPVSATGSETVEVCFVFVDGVAFGWGGVMEGLSFLKTKFSRVMPSSSGSRAKHGTVVRHNRVPNV